MKLTIGYIPEHFSTPLLLAEKHGFYKSNGVEVEFKPFPSGSGHLIQSLQEGSINGAVGLTEAFIRATAAGNSTYKILGTYVATPLCWAISTGANRNELTDVSQIEGGKCGVSRMGSGSDVMSKVLKSVKHWNLDFDYQILNTFENLRNAVNSKTADFFMWEHFTSKKYYDNGEIKKIGEIYTPWPSWVIVMNNDVLINNDLLKRFLKSVNEGVAYFNNHLEEGTDFITANFDYSTSDAKEWLKTVKFNDDVGVIDPEVVEKTIETLKTAVSLPKDCESLEYVYNVYK